MSATGTPEVDVLGVESVEVVAQWASLPATNHGLGEGQPPVRVRADGDIQGCESAAKGGVKYISRAKLSAWTESKNLSSADTVQE